MPSPATSNYILPPRGYFWAWSDDYAVEWEDGSTVAVWEEIDAVLSFTAPTGLPPLGSIVLILVACSEQWESRWQQVRHLASASTGESQPLRTTERLLLPVEAALNKIHQLPADLRKGASARCALISAVFEGVFNRLPPAVSSGILSDLKREGLEFRRQSKPDLGIHTRLLRDLSALDVALARLDFSCLEQRLRTGIDAPGIKPAEVPEVQTVDISGLPILEQLALQKDTELSAIAKLAQRVVAMMSVPRVSQQLRSLPCGGVSDISNRGDLTRMLMSELAWDDEMFTARLAHNETLYYQREVPPDSPESMRSILLDHGIRLWGLPRVYALAVALALASQDGASPEFLDIRRRDGAEFHSIPLRTVKDVQSHLAELSPSVNPTEALRAWVPAPEAGRQDDVFLIAEQKTLQSNEVVEQLGQWFGRAKGTLRLFTIGVDREGHLEFAQRTFTGVRPLAKCRLDLDALLPSPAQSPAVSAPLPPSQRLYSLDQRIAKLAFYQQWPLPIPFKAVPAYGQLRNSAWRNCIVAVDMENRLMAWTNPNDPAMELGAGLPNARRYWVDPNPGAFFSVICSAHVPGESVKLCRIHHRAEAPEVIGLKARHCFPGRATFENGAAILHYSQGAEAFSLTTGLRIAEVQFPSSAPEQNVTFDGQILQLGSKPQESRPFPDRDEKTLVKLENLHTPAPTQIGLVDGKLALSWKDEIKVWSAMGKRFETFKRATPPGAAIPFREIQTDSESKKIPAFWHAHSSAGDFYYDSRGILHIVIEDAEVTLPVFSEVATEVWTNPPKSGRKTIAEVERRLQVLAVFK